MAKTRALASNEPLILLRTNMGAGHFGATGVYSSLREAAIKYAFLLRITCAVTEAEGLSGIAPGARGARAAVCVPCIMVFIAVVAAFAALVMASLYYGGGMLQSLWTLKGERGGFSIREVAMQGFAGGRKRNGGAGREASEHSSSSTGGSSRTGREQERERLIGANA